MVIIIVWFVFIHLEQKTNLNLKQCMRKCMCVCNVTIPSKDTKILELSYCHKCDKAPLAYAGLESLMVRRDRCK